MDKLQYKKINNILGWIIFLAATFIYVSTMEKAGSFWDCGEFAASAVKLQNPHPPGAPFFILIGRIFVIFFGWILTDIQAVNLLSALSSSLTILLLFWTITFFAKQLIVKEKDAVNKNQLINIMCAGVIGALSLAFSDTFWFNAVEAEVYALASLFMALPFWMIIRWNNAVDERQPFADRWLILIALTIGISIGIHLLSILTIPVIVFFYYFKKYPTTKKGLWRTFFFACMLTGFTQKVLIQYTTQMAASLDLMLVNGFGLPMYSGLFLFLALLVLVFYIVIKRAIRRGWYLVKLLSWSFIFILVGLATYTITIVRSNANTPIDMYNVDNLQSLVGYLSREQYGDFPLLYGPVFTAQPIDRKEVGTRYKAHNGKYVEIGKKTEDVFASKDKMFFPRVWDYNNQQDHIRHYRMWLNLEEGERPSFVDNIKWFLVYQINWMYIRYFMWNFAGRQNDIQNVNANVRDGNWISGIPFIDKIRLGNQESVLPDHLKNMPSRNTLFMLPFILGIIGMLLQYKKDKKNFVIVGLLFFFSGIGLMLYLNSPGNQPRERDYVFAGSFYSFAVWIGLGYLYVQEWLRKKLSPNIATSMGFAICFFAVPVRMAQQEWDDHDRGEKTLVRDMAVNYLESCPPNAILFCYGDNDTYPLWYAQQVENIRKDIRVINTALLGAEWYVNQMRYKLDDSDKIDLPFSEDKTIGSANDIIFYNINKELNQHHLYPLDTVLNMAIDKKRFQVKTQSGLQAASLPVSRFIVRANEKKVRKNIATIQPSDIINPNPTIIIPEQKIKQGYMFRNDIAVLATIASLKWERPICFTSPTFITNYNLERYARSLGMVYELVPIANNTGVNSNWIIDRMENDYQFTSTQTDNVYYNEEGRRNINILRSTYINVISDLIKKNRIDEAKRLLRKCLDDIPIKSKPFAERYDRTNNSIYTGVTMAELAYEVGDTTTYKTIYDSMHKMLTQEIQYYQAMSPDRMAAMQRDAQVMEQLLRQLERIEQKQEG